MSSSSPMLDIFTMAEEVYPVCDSQSNSSTSEPPDETMDTPANYFSQSFLQKLNELPSDNRLYFTSTHQHTQSQSLEDNEFMFDTTSETTTPARLDTVSPLPFLDQSSAITTASPQQQKESLFQPLTNDASVIQAHEPAMASAASDSNRTFWSGFNNVAHNSFPQAIPNMARNLMPSTAPQLPNTSPAPQTQPVGTGVPSTPSTAFSSLAQNTFKGDEQDQNTDGTGAMQIRVLGIPQTGAKSRVETQIKLCIQLVTDNGDKAQWWSHLKLPEHMAGKDKLKRHNANTPLPNGNLGNPAGLDNNNLPIQPEKMLCLSARVICASDPSRKVVPCMGCIQRERKRAQRRKENKVKAENDDENHLDLDDKPLAIEEQRVLLFNCPEIVDFSSGDTILPTRITCYCRHHDERLGFCIYFEMHDQAGNRVATGISPPIMITDDHKSSKLKAGRKRLRTEMDKSSGQTMIAPGTGPSALPQLSPLGALERSPMHPTEATTPFNTMEHAILSTRQPQQQAVSHPAPTIGQPQIQRIIPTEGPTYGGIEVTVLGTGFSPGLTCMFGDIPATDTHYWSPNTLVCVLPPALVAGPVVVCLKGHAMMVDSQNVTVFSYYNESDRALMELALQVVGLKMTGKVEDAKEIAMRIVRGGNESQQVATQPGTGVGDQQQRYASLERHVIQILQVMDATQNVMSDDVSVTNAQQQTLLHLAAMLGFEELVSTLLDLDCDVDATDRNGYTSLHYASWHGHHHIVRLLLEEGNADPDIQNRDNKRPEELARDDDTRQVFKDHRLFEIDYIATVQYLEQDEDGCSSSEEILDAEQVSDESVGTLSSDEEDQVDKQHPRQDTTQKSSWVQRTLSHFQQQKDQRPSAQSPTDTSFFQNLKNSMPNKVTDLGLKTVSDHLLQLPPVAMIANMSVLFSNETGVAKPHDDASLKNRAKSPEEPERTLAWYLTLAYAMGVRNGGGNMESSSTHPNKKQQYHASAYTSATPLQANLPSHPSPPPEGTVSASSSYDSYYPQGFEPAVDRKRGDITLFTVWVPLLCLALIWLLFQFMAWIGYTPSVLHHSA